MLAANSPIVSILDDSVLTAVISVIERDYPKVRIGQEATVETDAYSGRSFSGKTVRIAPLLNEASRQARVEIEVPNAERLLKPGMFVRVQIEFSRHKDATVIPQIALVRRNGEQGVFLADTEAMKALGLSLNQILERMRDGNVTVPAGEIDQGNLQISIRTRGEYTNLQELKDTVVATREGAPVQLKEIASVEDSWEKVTRLVRVDGESGIRMGIYKQSAKNTVDVARAVLKEIERINADIPQIRLTPIIDTSDYIKRSISNVSSSAVYGGILAIFVLLFFLRNARTTTVIATAIPISIIATFALMYFSGFTLNIMTLGGLALGIGMLLDNSIVVLENISRLRASGQSSEMAAIDGSEQVTSAIVASTLTTLVVFLPLIFVRGMAGVMFKQFSLVVSFALLCSLAVAVTLVLTLSARILRSSPRGSAGRVTFVQRISLLGERVFERMEEKYKQWLHIALDHRALLAVIAAVVLVGSLGLSRFLGLELMPSTDEGEVRISAEMAVGTRLDVLDARFEHIEKIAKDSVQIERKNQERIVTVSASISGRDMGSIVADIREGLRSVPVPPGLSIVFGGDYEEQQKAFSELILSLILALVLVYMVMACQFESLRDPFVVMFSVPLAAIGVILMLFVTNTTFNIQSFIGCIMLGGIVVNNAILLVDHTNLLRRQEGLGMREAIEEAGRRRLRPILMTALTTMLALVPLALGLGEGGEAQAPLARTVIGGLLSSTPITLFFVPIVYSVFERRRADKHGKDEGGRMKDEKRSSA